MPSPTPRGCSILSCSRRFAACRPAALAEFAALDYASIGEIPALADPARLPPGAGTTVLNLPAGLALDGERRALPYRGPYPTEQLFLALLESFRYVGGAGDDPLAAFAAGALAWDPAPHERRVERDGVVVQLRDRVEKVVWGRRTYYRPDWQTVGRHAPRRVRDAGRDVVCSLWILGAPIEDHLRLTRHGALLDIAPFVRETGRALSLEWGAVVGDLLAVDGSAMRISTRVRAAAIERLAVAGDRAGRVAYAFALVGELAALVGDALRGDAQALLAGRPAEEQEAALAVVDDPGRAVAAAAIGRGVEALLTDLGAAT
ncbi:MAG: hypothetical protein HYR51_20420 [Candidatus Rokubacteria bacterium]|nr:hypothetical protein [Candidatus Rokubacteria bacterium]